MSENNNEDKVLNLVVSILAGLIIVFFLIVLSMTAMKIMLAFINASLLMKIFVSVCTIAVFLIANVVYKELNDTEEQEDGKPEAMETLYDD